VTSCVNFYCDISTLIGAAVQSAIKIYKYSPSEPYNKPRQPIVHVNTSVLKEE